MKEYIIEHYDESLVNEAIHQVYKIYCMYDIPDCEEQCMFDEYLDFQIAVYAYLKGHESMER